MVAVPCTNICLRDIIAQYSETITVMSAFVEISLWLTSSYRLETRPNLSVLTSTQLHVLRDSPWHFNRGEDLLRLGPEVVVHARRLPFHQDQNLADLTRTLHDDCTASPSMASNESDSGKQDVGVKPRHANKALPLRTAVLLQPSWPAMA
jgi:hypothetical protein